MCDTQLLEEQKEIIHRFEEENTMTKRDAQLQQQLLENRKRMRVTIGQIHGPVEGSIPS